jgi:hypothetical protein
MKNDFDSRVRENSSVARTDFDASEETLPFGSDVGARSGDVNAENKSVMPRPPFLDPAAPSSGARVRAANAFATRSHIWRQALRRKCPS